VSVLHVEIRGRVQGVGFRWFVREHARALALAGWVRNLGDGSVELVASGPDDALRELLSLLKEGPPGARVHEVFSLPPDPSDDLPNPFSISR
jgi:acylphosphatase